MHDFTILLSTKGVANHEKICEIAACFTSDDDVRLLCGLHSNRIGVRDGERMLEPSEGSLS